MDRKEALEFIFGCFRFSHDYQCNWVEAAREALTAIGVPEAEQQEVLREKFGAEFDGQKLLNAASI